MVLRFYEMVFVFAQVLLLFDLSCRLHSNPFDRKLFSLQKPVLRLWSWFRKLSERKMKNLMICFSVLTALTFWSLMTGALIFSATAAAAEIDGVTMPEKTKVGADELLLNGMAMRKVTRFGIPVKVYVGGLYLKEKSFDSVAIINSETPKRLIMEFVRPVDRDALIDGFRSGYISNCVAECEKKDLFTGFKNLIVNVRKGNRIQLDFAGDKVKVKTDGPNAKEGELQSAALVKNLLAIFIGEKNPPTPEFRKGLLGK